jgi:hypothetical protein
MKITVFIALCRSIATKKPSFTLFIGANDFHSFAGCFRVGSGRGDKRLH